MKALLLFLAILGSGTCRAQCIYDFLATQEPYVHLANSQSLNGTLVWDDVNYKPDLGFGCELDWTQLTKLAIVINPKGEFIGIDTTSLFNGFCILDADLQDRGKADTISKSGIRYRLDGGGGSKIFKIEFYNAGFRQEKELYGTMNDSVSMQVWLHQGSNVIELRYGPSGITHATDYFLHGSGPVIGFARDAGLFSFNVSQLYYLTGNPVSPVMDSCGTGIENVTAPLDAFPPSGTVYRFSPKPNSIKHIDNDLSCVLVKNTVCNNDIIVVNNENEPVAYQIHSLSGALTRQSALLSKGTTKIDLSLSPQGVYLLQLQSANGYRVERIIKL